MTAVDQARIRAERARLERELARAWADVRAARTRLGDVRRRCTHPDLNAAGRCPDCGGPVP